MINSLSILNDLIVTDDHIDLNTKKTFLARLATGKLTKSDDPINHFCSFLVPVHKDSQSIFVGHHIKADEWIPPGGHIELGETPVDTVRREFTEELSYELTSQRINFFDISIMNVNSPTRPCRMHNDFWFAVYMDSKVDFLVDTGEFYKAAWLPIDQAIKRAKRKMVINSLTHLKLLLTRDAI